MRFGCRIGWHDWGKWSNPYQSTVRIDFETIPGIMIQDRTCCNCGITKFRIKK